jgi:asparagine synthase (glutamine-hydrolysing)
MLYRFMRQDGVTVTLDGQGGDEVFGGYEQTILSSLFLSGDLLRTPRRALDLLATVSRMREPSLQRRLGEALLSDRWLRRAAGIVPGLRRWLDGLKSEWKTVDKVDPQALARLGPLRALLLGHWIEQELPMLLQTFDLFSMAHGVEVRMPLLDWRLVTYVLSLPDASLVSDGWTKRVLREAMRGRVPNAILGRRDKQGFSGPLRPWVQHGQLRDFVVHHAQQPEFLAEDRAEARRVRGIVDGWCRGDAGMGLWDERDVGVAVSETWVATSWARHGRSIRLSDAPPRMVPESPLVRP